MKKKCKVIVFCLFLFSCGNNEVKDSKYDYKFTIIFSNAWTRWWDSTDYYEVDTTTNLIHYRDSKGDSIIRTMFELEKIEVHEKEM